MIDYISREEAILALLEKGQHSKRYKIGETWELNFAEIQKVINEVPVADVVPRKDYESMERTVDKLNKALAERKHGEWGYRWKVHGDGRRPTELFPCSECGFENTSATNYCPNCGADMREKI